MDYELYDDEQLVNGILRNDGALIEYFFYRKYSKLLQYISYEVFDGQVDTNELISELFLYLAKDNWHKIRQFAFKSTLTTWLSVVATRFFLKKRSELIENQSTESQLIKQRDYSFLFAEDKDLAMDIQNALDKMTNERYKFVIQRLDLQGATQEEVASSLNTSLSNLYNIHHRALLQLKIIMGRKEDYYDR